MARRPHLSFRNSKNRHEIREVAEDAAEEVGFEGELGVHGELGSAQRAVRLLQRLLEQVGVQLLRVGRGKRRRDGEFFAEIVGRDDGTLLLHRGELGEKLLDDGIPGLDELKPTRRRNELSTRDASTDRRNGGNSPGGS